MMCEDEKIKTLRRMFGVTDESHKKSEEIHNKIENHKFRIDCHYKNTAHDTFGTSDKNELIKIVNSLLNRIDEEDVDWDTEWIKILKRDKIV